MKPSPEKNADEIRKRRKQIKEDFMGGMGYADIGKKYKISRQRAHQIVRESTVKDSRYKVHHEAMEKNRADAHKAWRDRNEGFASRLGKLSAKSRMKKAGGKEAFAKAMKELRNKKKSI